MGGEGRGNKECKDKKKKRRKKQSCKTANQGHSNEKQNTCIEVKNHLCLVRVLLYFKVLLARPDKCRETWR